MRIFVALAMVLFIACTALFGNETAITGVYKKALRDFAAGNFEKARAGFINALESPSMRLRAKSCSYLGDIYFFKGENDKALKYYQRALSSEKIRSVVRYRIGRTLVFMGKYNEGMTGLREFLVHRKPKDGLEDHALFGIARAYQGLGQKENALRTLDILTDLNPDTGLKKTVVRYWAMLVKWDQREEYQSDLKKIFSKENNDNGIERGVAGPEELESLPFIDDKDASSSASEEKSSASSLPDEAIGPDAELLLDESTVSSSP